MRQDLQLLQGAIDSHCHTAPSLFPRVCDHVECARLSGARPYLLEAGKRLGNLSFFDPPLRG